MAGKLISTTIISDNNQERPADKRDGKFVKKSYPRPWQVELTDEEIEVLKKSLKEDERRCEAKAKRLAENKSLSEFFNKNNRKE
jgi:5-bromo-4-chloroindolyl phosphate hydrolysis protein